MENKEHTVTNLDATKIAFGVIIIVLSGLGFALLNSLLLMLNSWSAQVRPSEQAQIAEDLMPFMPILTLFNLMFLLLGVYLLIEALQKKRSQ
jgi:RsiW-degrading membrane proteinase PrsW (M82 family)